MAMCLKEHSSWLPVNPLMEMLKCKTYIVLPSAQVHPCVCSP